MLLQLRAQLCMPLASACAGNQGMTNEVTDVLCCSREQGQKCVQLETALAVWRLLFQQQPWPLSEAWCTFLETQHKR